MCRNIKTLRPPVTLDADEDDFHAAALQYVRKVSGFRAPAAHNREAFDRAVEAVTEATARLLAELEVRGASARAAEATA
ncbi:DUF2277 domain-containing protein [Kitasatospora sp. NPDC093558]|uniref:DUF2277 domain-containing protein n=1 Tax=Kitasatospora sp. NPDC093558 TaxID=3155201 RepID=UPI003420E2EE